MHPNTTNCLSCKQLIHTQHDSRLTNLIVSELKFVSIKPHISLYQPIMVGHPVQSVSARHAQILLLNTAYQDVFEKQTNQNVQYFQPGHVLVCLIIHTYITGQ